MIDDLMMLRRDDPDLNCVFVRWRGQFSKLQAVPLLRAVEGSPIVRAGADVLHDLREVDFSAPSTEIIAVARRTDLVGDLPRERRIAAIAESDLGFGMMRMYFSLRSTPNTEGRAFRQVRNALEWLRLPLALGDPFARLQGFEAVVPEVSGTQSPKLV